MIRFINVDENFVKKDRNVILSNEPAIKKLDKTGHVLSITDKTTHYRIIKTIGNRFRVYKNTGHKTYPDPVAVLVID